MVKKNLAIFGIILGSLASLAAYSPKVDQGQPGPLASPWPFKISDGTSSPAIKPALTAPTNADPALVVGISPNSPITVTSIPPVATHINGSITAQCPTGTACPAGSTLQVTTDGFTTLGFETHGTWTATMTQDVSFDPLCETTPNSVNWYQTASVDTDTNESAYLTSWGNSKNNDPWVMNVASAQCARLRATSYSSGSVDIMMDTGVGPSMVWALAVGNVNAGSADLGGPLKVGGRYNLSLPTLSDGNRGDLQLDSSSRLIVAPITNAALEGGGHLQNVDTNTSSTVTNQTNGSQKAQRVDGSGNVAPAMDLASRAGFQKLTDGTNVTAVKSASSSATTSDPAAVIAISPNSNTVQGLGTTGSPSGGIVSVQGTGNVNMSPIIIAGASGTGVAPTHNPVSVSGVDGGGLKRAFLTDTSGNSQVVGSVASGTADSGNPVKVGGKYNTTQPTLTNGQRGDLQLSAFGDLAIAENTIFLNITTATTTTVKSGAGLLYYICHNTLVNNATVTIYDNTTATGTIVGKWTQLVGGGAAAPAGCQPYGGMKFSTGLTVVTSGASDLTIIYK